jgi:hypothetical protein
VKLALAPAFTVVSAVGCVEMAGAIPAGVEPKSEALNPLAPEKLAALTQ